MARIFQAYQCQYAFLLDMNALEHTYLAVYRRSGGQLSIDHLLRGMSVVDKSVSGKSRSALSSLSRQPGLLLCNAAQALRADES